MKLVFIVGIHKSGSSYLRALLDGHPDLSVLPFETHPFEVLGLQTKYKLRRKRDSGYSYLRKIMLGMTKRHFNFSDQPNFIIKPEYIDKFLAAIDWKLLERKKYAKFLISYWKAILDYCGYSPKNLVIEKSVENLFYIAELRNMFPDAKFIHIYRPFIEHLNSLRTYFHCGVIPHRWYRCLHDLVKSRRIKNQYINDPDFYVVNLKDLRKNTELEMRKIAKFLQINFHPKLLELISFRQPWISNSQRLQRKHH